MKLKLTKNKKFSITGLSADMAEVIVAIMNTANDKCFNEYDKVDNGAGVTEYYSGESFALKITEGERNALREFCRYANSEIARICKEIDIT